MLGNEPFEITQIDPQLEAAERRNNEVIFQRIQQIDGSYLESGLQPLGIQTIVSTTSNEQSEKHLLPLTPRAMLHQNSRTVNNNETDLSS